MRIRATVGGIEFDTETADWIWGEGGDEHEKLSIYRTPDGHYFVTESTSDNSVAWRFHNSVRLISEEEAATFVDLDEDGMPR